MLGRDVSGSLSKYKGTEAQVRSECLNSSRSRVKSGVLIRDEGSQAWRAPAYLGLVSHVCRDL